MLRSVSHASQRPAAFPPRLRQTGLPAFTRGQLETDEPIRHDLAQYRLNEATGGESKANR